MECENGGGRENAERQHDRRQCPALYVQRKEDEQNGNVYQAVEKTTRSHCCQLLMYRERVSLFYRLSRKEICCELINLSVVMPHLKVLVCEKTCL